MSKLRWFRLGGGTSERQWKDVQGLIRMHSDLDADYLARWASYLEVSDLLEQCAGECPG